MRLKLALVGILLTFVVTAQNNALFFAESGACVNMPFEKTFILNDDNRSTTNYHLIGKTRTAGSVFIKTGFEKPFHLNSNLQLSFPIGFLYRDKAEAIALNGYVWGCTGGFSGTINLMRHNHSVLFSVGPKLIMAASEKISIEAGCNMSTNFMTGAVSKITETGLYGTYEYVEAMVFTNISFSSSFQSAILYRLSSKLKAGISAEYFFYTYVPFSKTNYFGYFLYSPNSTTLNTGLKLQFSL